MSFDSIPTNSQSNTNNFGGAQGVSAGDSNVFTTNYSPAMNGAMGTDGMDSGTGSADSSMTPNTPIKRKSKLPLKMIFSIVFLFMLVIGGGAGYYLTQVNQDVRNQAAGGSYGGGSPCTRDDECSLDLVCRSESGGPDNKRCLPAILPPLCTENATRCTNEVTEVCKTIEGRLRWQITDKGCGNKAGKTICNEAHNAKATAWNPATRKCTLNPKGVKPE